MIKEEENMDWEKEAPLLASLDRQNAFTVPDGYFEGLQQNVMSEIALEQLQLKTPTFEIPANYFEESAEIIKARVLLESIKESVIHNDAGFKVPDSYFEDLKSQTIQHIKPKKTNVIRFNFLRYATAACILLTTSLGIYFNVKHTNNVSYQLSQVSSDDLETYLKQNTDAADIPMIVESLDEDVINDLSLPQEN